MYPVRRVRLSFLSLVCCMIVALGTGCPRTRPCDYGISVLDIDDSGVDRSILDRVYASGQIVGWDDLQASPTRNIVVIPYETPNYPSNPEVTNDAIVHDFFKRGTRSLSDYFLEVSYGQYWLENAGISNMVAIDKTTAFFQVGAPSNDWTQNRELHRLICQGSSIDWGQLDANKDRRITPNEVQVCFMAAIGHAGACRPSTVTIQHNDADYVIEQRFVFFDCLPENDPRETTEGGNIRYNFPPLTHELLHGIFWLPDRYGRRSGTGVTGQFDMMSDPYRGMMHLNIHDKMKIGWIRPKVRMRTSDFGACLSFPASESTAAALVLNPIFTSMSAGTQCEYWIVENRSIGTSPQNWDLNFPESGLCVWYVRDIPGRQDEVHLIDAQKPDQKPTNYMDQDAGALFKEQSGNSVGSRRLYLSNGEYAGFNFGYISEEGPEMFGEF
ncbi:MAG: hypothetical protein QG656_273 [Candidatus Hydrogenedentes bacterium]|nr:hypothetical protein [Candidatus Hydrogenedentota bacterium]